jgi:peptide/nickel transport system substrate-binding protein
MAGRLFRAFLFLLLSAPLAPASAATLRWSSAGDLPSWDIHSQNNALGNGLHAAVYEPLFDYTPDFEVVPWLATAAKPLGPTQWRISLRRDVRFHDGSAFTAADAVFSIERAMHPASNFGVYTQGIARVVKVDEATFDIHTNGPAPVLLRQLTELRMMSRAWAEAHRSATPKDAKARDENHAHRHAMGTGPFKLQRWEPDVRLELVENPAWWGRAAGHKTGNLSAVVYTPIKAEATRVAALLSGEVDLLLDPAPADLPRLRADARLKVLDGVENRSIFLGMDQFRDELPGSDVKGRNPLKDRRVRLALLRAIDVEAIGKNIMRGLSLPAGTLIAPQVQGWSAALDAREPPDPAAARRLLAEAGYPEGFTVDFVCPNNRYVNDEEVCQAVAAMWARIGVKARLRTLPVATYFPMLQRFEASLYMLGWGVPTFDALYTLQSLLRSVGAQGDGNYNVGRFSHPRMDALVERIKREADPATRKALIGEALALARDEVAYLPLHHQVIPWAMRRGVELRHRADNRLDWRAVTVR